MPSLRKIGIWSVAFLNMVDAILTVWCLKFEGVNEVNPIMAACLNVSPEFFLFVKFMMGLGWLYYFKKAKQNHNGMILIIFLMFFVVVLNNLSILLYIHFFHKHI